MFSPGISIVSFSVVLLELISCFRSSTIAYSTDVRYSALHSRGITTALEAPVGEPSGRCLYRNETSTNGLGMTATPMVLNF